MKPCNTFYKASLSGVCASEKDINKRLRAVDNETAESIAFIELQYLWAVIETAIDYKVLYEQPVEQYRILVNESSLKIAAFQHELANLKRLIFGK